MLKTAGSSHRLVKNCGQRDTLHLGNSACDRSGIGYTVLSPSPAPRNAIWQNVAIRDMGSNGNSNDDVKLESWKEIAAFLERDLRTVIRWEK
jgi:hypothetical protein